MVPIPPVTKFRNTLWTQDSAPRLVQLTQGENTEWEKNWILRGYNEDLNLTLQSIWNFNQFETQKYICDH